MKTFDSKTLMFLAAVACLPIACGTSPTGADVAALGADTSTVASALRVTPPMPPIAPEVPSPNTVPVPVKNDPGVDTAPQPTTAQPTNINPNGRRPAPQPNAGAPVPSADPGPVPAPSDPGPVPTPVKCLAASVEIVDVVLYAGFPGTALQAILKDEGGIDITDTSCDSLTWHAEVSDNGVPNTGRPGFVIIQGSSPRNVTLTGLAGVYKVGVSAPNGTSASRLVTVQ
jgi:hypothetical protein